MDPTLVVIPFTMVFWINSDSEEAIPGPAISKAFEPLRVTLRILPPNPPLKTTPPVNFNISSAASKPDKYATLRFIEFVNIISPLIS